MKCVSLLLRYGAAVGYSGWLGPWIIRHHVDHPTDDHERTRSRVQHSGGDRSTEVPHYDGHGLPIEGRVPASVLDELRKKGHDVTVIYDWTPFVGGGQGVMVDPDSGAFFAGADPRRDGYGMAY